MRFIRDDDGDLVDIEKAHYIYRDDNKIFAQFPFTTNLTNMNFHEPATLIIKTCADEDEAIKIMDNLTAALCYFNGVIKC